jgi:hypothetical protein
VRRGLSGAREKSRVRQANREERRWFILHHRRAMRAVPLPLVATSFHSDESVRIKIEVNEEKRKSATLWYYPGRRSTRRPVGFHRSSPLQRCTICFPTRPLPGPRVQQALRAIRSPACAIRPAHCTESASKLRFPSLPWIDLLYFWADRSGYDRFFPAFFEIVGILDENRGSHRRTRRL